MKAKNSMDELEARAAEALRELLGEVSVIKLKGIRREAQGAVLAHVDVLGHTHTLACEVRTNTGPENLRNALRELHDDAAHFHDAVPVLIAPYLSPEAQALCKENHAGFLDLEGNARLALGEVFIGRRAPTHRAPAASVPLPRAIHGARHTRPSAA
ncbi:MAG: hypothetical protein ACLGP3_05730 [Acidobacteriota bacterium]